jgi:hypothetical protein
VPTKRLRTSEPKTPKAAKPIRFIDGWSESAWKSLAVKALRIGWPEGILQARHRLNRSTIAATLTVGLFEDTFPSLASFPAALAELKAEDFAALCSRDTHHGIRALSDRFCDLEQEARAAKYAETEFLMAEAKRYGFWMTTRARNVFWTWLTMKPSTDAFRAPCLMPWSGMPAFAIDDHTFEGRRDNRGPSMLSGHYDTHRALGIMVRSHGWDHARQLAFAPPPLSPAEPVHDEPRQQQREQQHTLGLG